MPTEYQLTPDEIRELKAIFMQLWHEGGEGFNRSSSAPEVTTVWYAAVCTYLATCENRLNDSNKSAKNSDDDDSTVR